MCRSPNLSALNFPKLAAVCPTVVTKSIQVPPPRTQMPFSAHPPNPGALQDAWPGPRDFHQVPAHPGPYAHPGRCLPSEAWRVLLEVTADEGPGARPGSTMATPGGFPVPARRARSRAMHRCTQAPGWFLSPVPNGTVAHKTHPLLEASLESDSVGKAGPQVLGHFTATNCRAGFVPKVKGKLFMAAF